MGDTEFHDGFVGISRKQLEAMGESELAQWQSTLKADDPKHILAEREWQRRMITHQLQEQYQLDEKVQKVNRWWALAAAGIGVLGTLAGAYIGRASVEPAPSVGASPAAIVAPVADAPKLPSHAPGQKKDQSQ